MSVYGGNATPAYGGQQPGYPPPPQAGYGMPPPGGPGYGQGPPRPSATGMNPERAYVLPNSLTGVS